MKRFNLLLVTQESGLREAALRALSRVYKSNFVFEVPNMEEAHRMLAKLHIDILMVDLDIEKGNLVKLSAKLPSVQIMGLCTHVSRIAAKIDHNLHQVFEKRDFGSSFLAELKEMRKSPQAVAVAAPRKAQQAPAEATDFKDFFKLTSTRVGSN